MAEKDQFNEPNLENGLEIEDIFNEGTLSVFEDFGADRALLNSVNSELIKLAGSEISIYKFLSTKSFDDLYDEERIKVLSPVPIHTYGHYTPTPVEENLSEFGIELTNDIEFTFNKEDINKLLGRDLIPGDVIRPAFQNFFYSIHEVQENSFESYGVYTLSVQAKIWRNGDYIHKLWQSVPEFGISGVIETTAGVLLSDGYYMLVDVRYMQKYAKVTLGGGDKLPVMWQNHGGPGNRGNMVNQALDWIERGFFHISPDIRGRGESMIMNDPRFRGRSFENSIRHRLDIWEVTECIYQGEALVGKGGRTPLIFEPFKLRSSTPFFFDKETGKLVHTHNDYDMFLPHWGIGTFKKLMDVDNMHAVGFSLGGGVPLYWSVDSGHDYTKNMGKPKLVRYNYNNSSLEFGKPYLNPRTAVENPEYGFTRYNKNNNFRHPGSAEYPLKGFRSLKSFHGGGALINTWGHIAEGEHPGNIKSHYAFFLYSLRGEPQWLDPLSHHQKDMWHFFKFEVPGIWLNPICNFPVEYWWETWDWEKLEKFFRAGKAITDSRLDFVGYGATSTVSNDKVPYTPSALKHVDLCASTLPWCFYPLWERWQDEAVKKVGAHAPSYHTYGWYQCVSTGTQTYIEGKVVNPCKGVQSKYELGRLYSNTFPNYQPSYELFGTEILPRISEDFDSEAEWMDRWYTSDTHICFYLGYDDIFMAPVDSPRYFNHRAKTNKEAKTQILLTHGGAHGTAPNFRTTATIAKRETLWPMHWAFGDPYSVATLRGLGRTFIVSSIPNGTNEHVPSVLLQSVPPDDKYFYKRATTYIAQFDDWPVASTSELNFKLDDGKGNREVISHRLVFTSDDFISNISQDLADNGILPYLPENPGGGTPGGGIPPIPTSGMEFRYYYRTNIENFYTSKNWDHRLITPSTIDINTKSYQQFETYPDSFQVPMVSSTCIGWDSLPLPGDMRMIGQPRVVLNLSSNTGSFQVFPAIYEVSSNGVENYITGGMYSQVKTQTPDKWWECRFVLNPYFYNFRKGCKIRIKLWNMSMQQPRYVEGSPIEQIPGSKFPITGGVFTGLPCFNEFKLKVGTSSKVIFPINDSKTLYKL